jgi:hypothetical protein
VTQGSPALRANPGLKDGIPLGFWASYRNRAGTLSFADGHSETHRWVEKATMPRIRQGQWLPWSFGKNRGLRWLQDHATRLVTQ